MEITVKQAQDILNFVPTIEYLIKVFDTKITYQNKKVRYYTKEHVYSDNGENFLKMKDDNETYVVTDIEILFQSGNMDDDDTIMEYMTKTLGISEDDFEIVWDMLNGDAWMYIRIN